MKPRPDIQNTRMRVVMPLVQGYGDLPIALAQRRLQPAQDGQISFDTVDLPLIVQGGGQPFKIARRFMHVRLGHVDIDRARRRIHLDVPRGRRLADDLLVNLALGRHVDDHIAHHLGLTAQTPTLGQTPDGIVAFFNRVPFRQRIGMDGDAVLGKFAIARRDLAFGTDATPAADRIEIDAQLPCCGQHRRSERKTPPLARGGENHQRVGVGHVVLLPSLFYCPI